MEFSRRSILGGMLSILASANTQIIPAPARALAGNSIPRIFGDGKNYDSEGFQALFDGKDVIIPRDKLQVTGAKGLIFHRGTFVIDKEVYTNGCRIEIENAIFDGKQLQENEAFFSHFVSKAEGLEIIGNAKWIRDFPHNGMAIDIGHHQLSILNTHMRDGARNRPRPEKEI